MAKLCLNCLEINNDSKPMVENPRSSSEGNCIAIEIDDLLVDVIRKFWSLDLTTFSSCSGHLYENYFSPYITFFSLKSDEKNLRKSSEADLSKLNEANEVFIRLHQEGIIVCEIVMIDKRYEFTVRADVDPIKEQISPQERLEVQIKFLTFLYKAADEIEKLWFEEEVK